MHLKKIGCLCLIFYSLSLIAQENELVNSKLIAYGQRLYLGGEINRGLAACAACHDPMGLGNSPAKVPRLAGHSISFITKKLYAFKRQKSTNSKSPMPAIAKQLTPHDIESLAAYLSILKSQSSTLLK